MKTRVLAICDLLNMPNDVCGGTVDIGPARYTVEAYDNSPMLMVLRIRLARTYVGNGMLHRCGAGAYDYSGEAKIESSRYRIRGRRIQSEGCRVLRLEWSAAA